MYHPRPMTLAVAAGLMLFAGCFSGPPRPWFQKHGNAVPTTAGCEGCDGMTGLPEGPLLGDPNMIMMPGNGIPSNGGLPPGAIPVPPTENGGRLVPQPGVPPLTAPPPGGRLMPTPQAQPEPFRP